MAEPDDAVLLRVCLSIFQSFGQHPQALQMALRLNDPPTIRSVFLACDNRVTKRQLAFMLARQQVMIDLDEDSDEDSDEDTDEDEDEEDENELLTSIMSNSLLSEHFLALARELDIMAPKTPEDIYKSHLGRVAPQIPSSRKNLAATFVNAFVNAGFGRDRLLMDADGDAAAGGGESAGSQWIYRNKDHGMMSAAASVGMLKLWDISGGLAKIDAHLYSEREYIKSGALLACGIVSASVRSEYDAALAILKGA